jgi:hypothetical protein
MVLSTSARLKRAQVNAYGKGQGFTLPSSNFSRPGGR